MSKSDSQPEVLLTPKEAALQLKVEADTIRQMIHAGTLPASDISATGTTKARWRIAQSEIDAFLRMRASKPAPKVRRRRKKRGGKRYV